MPIIPEMIERLKVDLKIKDGEDKSLENKVNDLCNEAYGFIYSLMLFLSPLIGSNMYLTMGADMTLTKIAMVNVAMVLAILLFNDGFQVFKENKEFQQQLIELREQTKGIDTSVCNDSVWDDKIRF